MKVVSVPTMAVPSRLAFSWMPPLLILILAFLLNLTVAGSAGAAVITASSASFNHVSDAVEQAVDGDVVVIPRGTKDWKETLNIEEKAITIRGAGTNDTVLVDKIANRSPMFRITFTKRTGMFRLTGLQIKGNSNHDRDNIFGVVMMRGSNHEVDNSAWRIDNIYFNRQHGRPIGVYAWSGLIDHCMFDQGGSPGMAFDGRIPNPNNKGHRSWSTPVRWGTIDSGVYVENCLMTNSFTRAITDGFAGARFVFRNNVCLNVAAENHGTESTGIFRGTRSMEVYNNVFASTSAGEYAVFMRSGSGLIFSNFVTGQFPGLLRMVNYRERDPFKPWGQSNGLNPMDQNDPILYASGKHRSSGGSSDLVDSRANWTPDQWVGYHLINLDTGKSGQIMGNTDTTITCFRSLNSANAVSWSRDDKYEIRRVIRTLDGCGMGSGDLLTGGSNSDNQLPTPSQWPNQMDEPIRYWNNTGRIGVSHGGYYTIVDGRNYTNAPLPGYRPLVFPHPYASGVEVRRPNPPRNLRVVPSL